MFRTFALLLASLATSVSCASTYAPESDAQRVAAGKALCATTRSCLETAIKLEASNPDPEARTIELTRLGRINTQLLYCEMLLYMSNVVPDPETYVFAERNLSAIATELTAKVDSATPRTN